MANVIETNKLTKIYSSRKGDTRALSNVALQVQSGEIFGYLGPNGAGKTTTIRVFLDLIRPSSGSASIFGKDVNEESIELRKRIGYLPGELSLPKNRTATQIVRHLAEVRGMSDTAYAYELAERLSFDMTKKMRDYSTGNKRKMGIVLALMHKPDLLILDEPTSGLDPLMQQTFNELMMDIRNEGRTVFLSSHVLSEVQAICDRVGILRDGELRAVESVERLTHVDFRWVTMRFKQSASEPIVEQLQQLNGVSEVKADGRELTLRLAGDFDPILRVTNGVYIEDIQVLQPSLEEIFLNFYGNGVTRKGA